MKLSWKQWGQALFLVLCLTSALYAQTPQTAASGPAVSAQIRTPAWNYAVESGNWVNWTDISDSGDIVLAGSFRFNKTGEFATYCLDKHGTLRWKDTLSQSYTGVFWVDVSGSGKYAASGGWRENRDNPSNGQRQGFIRAYETSNGNLLLDYTTGARVNAVMLSQRGEWLAAASGSRNAPDNSVRLFQLNKNRYELRDHFTTADQSVGTLDISQDGRWIVAGSGGGWVRLFHNRQGKLHLAASWQPAESARPAASAPEGPNGGAARTTPTYVQFVDISDDGQWIAAAISNGHFYLFKRENFIGKGEPLWSFPVSGTHNVYGVRVSEDGRKVVACNNHPDTQQGGYLYMVTNRWNDRTRSYEPVLQWTFRSNRSPNPGISMDKRARYVALADGYPVGTPGHFYLLDAVTGKLLWIYQTVDMNWPVVLSKDGRALAGGSDDGKIYYWHNLNH